MRSLTLAPGERVEILVVFSNSWPVALETAPDTNLPMMMGPMARVRNLTTESFDAGNEVILEFEPVTSDRRSGAVPGRLTARQRVDTSQAARRRRFVLGMGGMMGGRMGSSGDMFINGRPFDMGRIDERVPLGDTEIWEISGEMMSHPFHIYGVQFEMLNRHGGKPNPRDAGVRDTVLVREPVELLVRFAQQAVKVPFVYHCHILEHEDNGMMGQFTTT